LNLTAVAFVRFEPRITTLCPIGPEVGEKLEIDGAGTTVNELELVAFPAGALTEIAPLDAPDGTVAVICPSLSTLNVVAFVPLKLTTVAPVKPEPEITTLCPIGPEVGLNPVIVVVGVDPLTVNEPALVPVPPGVVTEIGPVVAPVGTLAVICPSPSTVNVVAGVPLNFTALAFVKFEPEMTTL
jgi:hypothetical protein